MQLARIISLLACATLLAVATAGCKADPAAHPAKQRLVAFLDALKYKDAEHAAALHVESTNQGLYCHSKAFAHALSKARAKATPAECARVDKLGAAKLDRLSSEARLLVQIVRFACEQPKAGCAAYGQRVLQSQLDHLVHRGAGSRWAITDYKIQKVLGGANQAVAYVDLVHTGDRARTHQTLTLKKVGTKWYVSEPMTGRTTGER